MLRRDLPHDCRGYCDVVWCTFYGRGQRNIEQEVTVHDNRESSKRYIKLKKKIGTRK